MRNLTLAAIVAGVMLGGGAYIIKAFDIYHSSTHDIQQEMDALRKERMNAELLHHNATRDSIDVLLSKYDARLHAEFKRAVSWPYNLIAGNPDYKEEERYQGGAGN